MKAKNSKIKKGITIAIITTIIFAGLFFLFVKIKNIYKIFKKGEIITKQEEARNRQRA